MGKEEKVSTPQPQWDFPSRQSASTEVIQLPKRQPSYPSESRPQPPRDPR